MKCPLSPPRLTEKQGPERKRIRKEPVTRKAGLLFGMGLSGIRRRLPLSGASRVALLMQMSGEESANSPGEPRRSRGLRRPLPLGRWQIPPANLCHPLLACSGHDTSTPLSQQCVRGRSSASKTKDKVNKKTGVGRPACTPGGGHPGTPERIKELISEGQTSMSRTLRVSARRVGPGQTLTQHPLPSPVCPELPPQEAWNTGTPAEHDPHMSDPNLI